MPRLAMDVPTSQAAQLLADSVASAKSAGLRYVNDGTPGIGRAPARGGSFRYLAPDGSEVRDAATLDRIAQLRIPPAWTSVWICTDARGHIQATGRDARGRKQYRYHDRWREVRDATKFEKILDFGDSLPKLRARVSADMARPRLSRERVLATVVRLLDTTLIRIGNDEYARTNQHYGLTTIRNRHVEVAGDELVFRFTGKSGKDRRVSIRDARAARVVRKCQDLPGQELFKYVDGEGRIRDVTSEDVNAYLREIGGGDFTAKDFRTWAATVLAGLAIRQICSGQAPPASTDKQIVAAVKVVAEVLGNTPAVCRKSYVHPVVIDGHREGELLSALEKGMGRSKVDRGLRPEEEATLAFLRARLREAHAAPLRLAEKKAARTTARSTRATGRPARKGRRSPAQRP